MNVLVVGGGGREHAIVRALSRDSDVAEIHALPGNPGIGDLATLHAGDPLDGDLIAELAVRLGCDLVVVGPEGGIALAELGTLVAAGAVAVRLGPLVLRTSTAGPAALALLSDRLLRWS